MTRRNVGRADLVAEVVRMGHLKALAQKRYDDAVREYDEAGDILKRATRAEEDAREALGSMIVSDLRSGQGEA